VTYGLYQRKCLHPWLHHARSFPWFPPFRTTYGTTAETSPQRRLTRIVG
jgi:hypothetical protein